MGNRRNHIVLSPNNSDGKTPHQITVGGHVAYLPPYFVKRTGPSRIFSNGTLMYVNNRNEYHRLNGPAIIWASGEREYYVNGLEMSDVEYFLRYGK